MRRKTIIGILMFLLIIALFLVGCTTETTENADQTENDYDTSELDNLNVPEDTNQIPVNEPDEGQMPPTDSAGGEMPPSDGEFGGGRPGGMDEMQTGMLEACEGKSEGDSCTVEGPMGEEEGTCTLMNEELSCMMERQDDMMMPPEME